MFILRLLALVQILKFAFEINGPMRTLSAPKENYDYM